MKIQNKMTNSVKWAAGIAAILILPSVSYAQLSNLGADAAVRDNKDGTGLVIGGLNNDDQNSINDAIAQVNTNTSDIGTNTADIATNETDIGTNASDIQQEVDDRSALIRRESDGVHIGADSFILDDTASAHRLTTDDGTLILGGAGVPVVDVDADLDVDGDIFTSGDVFVGGNSVGLQAQLDANQSQISSNSQQIRSNSQKIEQNTRGIAMVAALQHSTLLPGMNNALDVGAAYFEGETGMSINYSRRVVIKDVNLQINFGAATTTDFEESVIKGGVGYQW